MDAVIDQYIERVLADEKEHYTSQLEPFDQYAAKLRAKLAEALQGSKKRFMHGHMLLAAKPIPDAVLSELDSLDKITAFLGAGKSLYELFGYSQDELAAMYKKAHQIVANDHFEDGYDAYSFLVTVAPYMREAWLNMGYTLCKLGHYLIAIEAFGKAFELDPTKSDSYLATIGAYKKQHNFPLAYQACELGLAYAEAHKEADWSVELTRQLHEAKRYLDQCGG